MSLIGKNDPCPRCHRRPYDLNHPTTIELHALQDENARLKALLNTPHIDNFVEAVRVEAAHQCERWGVENDAGKEPADWFWLIGYLAGKALAAAIKGDGDKAKHHTISSAAALLNWHAHMSGERTQMRPGIEPPATEQQP